MTIVTRETVAIVWKDWSALTQTISLLPNARRRKVTCSPGISLLYTVFLNLNQTLINLITLITILLVQKAKEGENCKTHPTHTNLQDCEEGLFCEPSPLQPLPPFPGTCIGK
jgi:hypothetical protein